MSTDRGNSESLPSARKRALSGAADRSQSDLFETTNARIEQGKREHVRAATSAKRPIARAVSASELPAYDDDETEIVDASLAEVSASKIWFTYADIRRYFGVSRATVARKLKAGLVPGIRFQGDRVLEDGAVRRFSRTQVRFVLLAVRRRDWRTSVS